MLLNVLKDLVNKDFGVFFFFFSFLFFSPLVNLKKKFLFISSVEAATSFSKDGNFITCYVTTKLKQNQDV